MTNSDVNIARLIAAICLVAACSATSPSSSAGERTRTEARALEMTPVDGSEGAVFEATSGAWKFVLADPDDPAAPTAWEGPLRIEAVESAASCEAPLSLITAVYSAPGVEVALVLTYSGSITYLNFVNLRTCAERWPRIEAFTPGLEIAGHRVLIQPGCECGDKDQACTCSAGRVFDLADDYKPLLVESESLELTKRVLGVAFEGTKKVERPRSPQARVVE